VNRTHHLPALLGMFLCALALCAPPSLAQAPATPAAPLQGIPGQGNSGPSNFGNDTRGGWRSACVNDVKQFCRGTSGGPAKRLCLDANLAKLSAPCQGALNDRRAVRSAARRACSKELQSICKDITGTRGAKFQCLQQKVVEASPECAKALANLFPGGLGGKSGVTTPKN
jgi:hypothetical protein